MRVLLIEDEATIAKSIELMLGTEGFNVYTTDLGEEGLDLGKLYDYDIILLDLNLPDMQQAARRVAVQPMHRHRLALEAELELARPGNDAVAAGARRIDRQAGRLVDDDRLGVDEEDAVFQHLRTL